MTREHKPVCVVVGAGPGNGVAFARRFAQDGYAVAALTRRPDTIAPVLQTLPDCLLLACDVTDSVSLEAALARVEAELGVVDTLIYNAGSGVWGTVETVSPDAFEQSWRVNALGGYVAARAVIPGLKRRGHGTIVFVGATASRRGGAASVAFAAAKAAQRSMAESLARHLWPSGIHVCLIVIDGVIDGPARTQFADKPDAFFIKPDAVASIAMDLCRQPPSAWSFEVEARPFGERW